SARQPGNVQAACPGARQVADRASHAGRAAAQLWIQPRPGVGADRREPAADTLRFLSLRGRAHLSLDLRRAHGPGAATRLAELARQIRQAMAGGYRGSFPLGFDRLGAYKAGDKKSARAWLHNAIQWKAQDRWNIMEEGVRLGLSNRLRRPARAHAVE